MPTISSEQRHKIQKNLLSKLGPGTPADISEHDISSLEDGIYNHANENLHFYNNQSKIIYLNLAPDSYINNTYLLSEFKSGRLTMNDISSMNESEMNPEKWQGAMSKIAEAKQVSHGPQVVASDIIKCRCGGQTTFTEQQTRSSDEAMTIKATCLKCGKKFNI